MTQIELQELLLELWNHEVDVKFVMWKLNNDPSASNNGNAIVSGSLPLVSREELISSLEDKRICKMSNLPADIYYLSRKETADYLMDNYLITKRQ